MGAIINFCMFFSLFDASCACVCFYIYGDQLDRKTHVLTHINYVHLLVKQVKSLSQRKKKKSFIENDLFAFPELQQ